jgi:hypothetical protein
MSGEDVYRDSRGRFVESQEAQRREVEVRLLDSATTMRQYNERREAQSFLVVDPEMPLDEMSMADYMKMRDRDEREGREPKHPPMGTSYREYFRRDK